MTENVLEGLGLLGDANAFIHQRFDVVLETGLSVAIEKLHLVFCGLFFESYLYLSVHNCNAIATSVAAGN